MSDEQRGPVQLIRGAHGGRYPCCNSVYLEGPGILIDPASDRERLTELRDGPGVREVWLSHWHEDHFAHLDLFDEVPWCIAEADAAALGDLEVFLDWGGIVDPDLRRVWSQTVVEKFNYRPRQPDSFLVPGKTVSRGGVTIDLIPTPGHTPGHLAFFIREPGVLCTGDYDLTPFGPWYGDVAGDIDLVIASVERLRSIDASAWITGHEHGLLTEAPDALWDDYLAVIDRREAQLLDYLSLPRTLDEIGEQWIIYGKPREPRSFFSFGERALMGKHLRRLAARGEVTVDEGRYRRVARGR